ncbi:A-kinase anchor protein 7-like isoform X2 [Physella acuta]|nr:A-kinase anchor protein 7-like isoform X2 [Physella acuta]XP_059140391.1 A-kinase anchor protein 7-like isoform X2 [Physella acuta]XP_059140392.1 A-kinase anchor protein 7-like isoform X2 [Physella acuta]XP_059140393.1 A-kinase anchor protein 7-like isoform X2 [Physella acuta]
MVYSKLVLKKPLKLGGKQGVLPNSVLMKLKSVLTNKKDSIMQQIIACGADLVPSQPVVQDLNTVSKQLEGKGFESCKTTSDSDVQTDESLLQSSETSLDSSHDSEKLLKKDEKQTDGQAKKRTRPNYFVAVQITDPEIYKVAKKVQSDVADNSKADITKAIIGTEKFHITLMVMHLKNLEDVQLASQTLDNCVLEIHEKIEGQQVTLDFEGLSAFNGGRVLFATLKSTQGLQHLHVISGEVHRLMGESGILSTDQRAFNPHLTLIKFDGHKGKKYGVSKLKPEMYEPYCQQVFGSQHVSSLQLCRMNAKREDGYYFVDHEAHFIKQAD